MHCPLECASQKTSTPLDSFDLIVRAHTLPGIAEGSNTFVNLGAQILANV